MEDAVLQNTDTALSAVYLPCISLNIEQYFKYKL
jgi:hypothetical protein